MKDKKAFQKTANSHVPTLLQSVWILYKAACEGVSLRLVALNTFCTLWRNTMPFVTVMKPMTDLCQVCQHNVIALMRAANTPDQDKSEVSSMIHCVLHYLPI